MSSALFQKLDDLDGGANSSGSGKGPHAAGKSAGPAHAGPAGTMLGDIDFDNPSKEMREIALQQGIDLDDPRVKQMLREQVAKHTGQAVPEDDADADAGRGGKGKDGGEGSGENEPPSLDDLLEKIRTGEPDRLRRLLVDLDDSASSEAVAAMKISDVKARLEELVRRDFEEQDA